MLWCSKYKAKVSYKLTKKLKEKKNGKLILVTAINPTPSGEGKTTISIGLADGLSKIGTFELLSTRSFYFRHKCVPQSLSDDTNYHALSGLINSICIVRFRHLLDSRKFFG